MSTFTVPPASDAPRRPPAPGELELVRQFVNTEDVEAAEDDLQTPAELAAWLVARGLLPAGRRLDERDLATARALRDALRDVLATNAGHGDAAAARRRLDSFAARFHMRMRLNGGARLEPSAEKGMAPAISGLLATIYDAMQVGTWERLKVCRNDECQWAFYDHSRNHSGAWCTMAICGNRMKGRAFRTRRARSGEG